MTIMQIQSWPVENRLSHRAIVGFLGSPEAISEVETEREKAQQARDQASASQIKYSGNCVKANQEKKF